MAAFSHIEVRFQKGHTPRTTGFNGKRKIPDHWVAESVWVDGRRLSKFSGTKDECVAWANKAADNEMIETGSATEIRVLGNG